MAGEENGAEGNAAPLSDAQEERAETEAASAPVADHRRQLEEAHIGAVDLALETELAENHGVDVVGHVRKRAKVRVVASASAPNSAARAKRAPVIGPGGRSVALRLHPSTAVAIAAQQSSGVVVILRPGAASPRRGRRDRARSSSRSRASSS